MIKFNLEENTTHGISRFPVAIYDVKFLEGNQQILSCHWHDEYEIIYISEGSATFKIDECTYDVHKSQALLINSGELHSAYTNNVNGCSYIAIVFKSSFIESSQPDVCQTKYIAPLVLKEYALKSHITGNNTADFHILCLIQQIIQKIAQQSVSFELYTKAYLLTILSIIFENNLLVTCPKESNFKSRQFRIKKVLTYIDENLSTKLTLDSLATIINMSRFHFCRFFKKYTSMSPIEYINTRRIDEAEKLLKHRDYSVTEAALEVGFENLSYFTKQFKKYKNSLPSEFLK